uniref:AP-4 complex accessory subunit RUSC1 isoform X2 n=1 Tax=Pristiophorus japonicus TaxID=55135 RepID=UPI00398EDE19
MAQRRRQSAPGGAKAREDRSDWLMAFSPDGETPRALTLPQHRPADREVVTFRELRYRSHAGRWSLPLGRGEAPWGSEAGGQGPRPAGDKEQALGRRGQSRPDPADGGQRFPGGHQGPRDGGRMAGDHPRAKGSLASGRAQEEAPSPDGRSERARGKADGRDKSIKEGLLWAVNVSVDQIVSHFSVARNIVQKAQLGDSRVSPLVGQLVLGGLCPALEAVVRDGLKPHQQDLIVGRRPNSPWSVVEASLKAGSAPRTLTSLYAQLDQLPQLGNPRRKFNAFVFGLLNLKRLDIWISALHDSTEVLRTHYVPTAFLLLSHSCCRPLFEELLLLLQPLAVLTFHLDPLFEYHHPSTAADPGGGGSEPGLREPSRPGGTPQHHHHQQQQQRAKGRRADEGPAEEVERGGGAETGYTLQQTLEQVGRWGDRLAQSLAALQKPPAPARPPHGADPDFSPPTALLRAGEGLPGRQRKLSWWDQLGHSSQIYLAPSREGSVFAKWMKPAAASNADSLHDRSKTPAATLATATGQEGGGVRNPGSGLRGSDGGGLGAGPAEDGQQDPTPSGAVPPGESRPPTASLRSEPDRTCPSRAGERLWLGRLFGARVPGTYSPGEPPPHQEGKAQRGRLPSAWLQVSLSPFDQRTRALPAGTDRAPPSPPEANPPAQDPTKPARRVRTLCDHTATEEDHLSFRRGETLEIVACVDEDWIRCCHGDASGLVPIGYTSLI